MKINRIILENFKCFENEKFELSSPYTLIIGDNGKGKTAILNAIARYPGGKNKPRDGYRLN